jgi:uncharacterized protein
LGDSDWVEQPDEGVLEVFEIHYYEMIHPRTGKVQPVPWANGLIKLDGGAYIEHYLMPPDPKAHKLGDRYKAVWKEEGRTGSVFDIQHFERMKEAKPANEILPQKAEAPKPPKEPHFMMSKLEAPYQHSAGAMGSRFLVALRDHQKIMGSKCPQCHKVFVPPTSICSECFCKIDELVNLGGQGTLETFTVVHYTEPSHPKEAPFVYGIIRMDGADTGLAHFLGEMDLDRIKSGMRVEPVFKDVRKGSMLDIEYFRPV